MQIAKPILAKHWMPETQEMLAGRGEKPELQLTRLKDFNERIWGIRKKELTVIGARPSNGKSNMAINIGYNLAEQNKKVLLLSLEMTVPRIMERMFCMEKEINNSNLERGAYASDADIKRKWDEFKSKIEKLPLNLSDMIGRQINDIDEILKDVQSPPDVIIIDHIQEISGDRKKEAIDKYLDKMRETAIRQNMAMVICSQINRLSQDSDNRTPQLHQLKGSGALEEKADNVFLLHWPYHHDQGKDFNYFEVNVAKNRNGRTGYVKLFYEPQFCRFRDWEQTKPVRLEDLNWEQ